MITVNEIAAQGDLLIQRVDTIPDSAIEAQPVDGKHIAAHSETGHHHWLHASVGKMFREPSDPLVCYLQVTDDFADFVHARTHDTHETIRVKKGNYKLTNQQEYGPQGWQRAAD